MYSLTLSAPAIIGIFGVNIALSLLENVFKTGKEAKLVPSV